MYRLLIFTVMFLLVACSTGKKTERDYYEETISGLKFNTYKTTSRSAIGPIVKVYNDQYPDSIPLNSDYAHVILSYTWTISKSPAMAFAEADLAEESDKNEIKLLAKSIRSIAMYEQGWDTLAHEESEAAKKYSLDSLGTDRTYQASFFYVMMGLAKIYDKDFNKSKFYWAGFTNETGIHWPYQLTDAVDDLSNRRIQQGLGKMKIISQDPAVPEILRTRLAEEIKKIEAKGGDVNSSLFWPRLISTYVFDEIKQTGKKQLSDIMEMLEGFKGKMQPF